MRETPRLALPAAVILLLLALALLILLSSIAQPAQALCKEHPCLNPEPLVGADNSLVVVDEGDTATNTGSFEDSFKKNMVPPSNVTLSASEGTITQSGTTSGTWSWSLPTTEVCADETKTVTITATDSEGATSTTDFSLTVKDSPGTIPAPNSERIAYEASPEERMCDDGRYDIFTIDPAGGGPSTSLTLRRRAYMIVSQTTHPTAPR